MMRTLTAMVLLAGAATGARQEHQRRPLASHHQRSPPTAG
jgi:hypothetical protein